MSDAKEVQMQMISPESPGQLAVQNPFESPNDYNHLQEQLWSSPTQFKSTISSATPGKFRWSIDELALINPVEIDSEDIWRQSMYLSRARIDKEIEEKRQKAIEEFFTKSIIVPSPWTDHSEKQVSQFNSTRCIDLSNASPVGREITVHTGRNNAACQTVLSLPVDFDLEKILGEYFKPDELADQSQESLSTSSLRRKLFLEENGSLSESFSPSQSPHNVPASLGVLYSIDISPVRCRSPLNTSSSGQFSSSPIQGGSRACSLGSLPSPSFPERSPANIPSPAFSPIGIQIRKTPLSDQRQFTFRSPDIPSVSNGCRPAPARSRNSYAECSPLKSCSPMRLVARRGTTFYQTSLVCLPSTPESSSEGKEEGAKALPGEASLPAEAKANLHPMNGDTFAHGTHLVVARVSISPDMPESRKEPLTFLHDPDSFKENHTVDMVDPEMLDDNSVKGLAENGGMPTAAFSIENSCMCMSPLAESSTSPYESSSIQADSGYSTQACTSSLMDTAASETSGRENDTHVFENQKKFHVYKTKQGKGTPNFWTENEPVTQSRSHLVEMQLSK